MAVDQQQRARRTEAAQRNRRRTGAAEIVHARVGVLAGDRRQVLHDVADRELAGPFDARAVDDEDRICGLDAVAAGPSASAT